MSRMTVFHHAENEAGYVAAVIHENDCHVFYGLGFTGSVDHVEPLAPSGDTDALTKEIEQLKQQLTDCHGEINGLQQLLEQTRGQLAAAQVKTDAPLMESDGAAKDQKKNSKA